MEELLERVCRLVGEVVKASFELKPLVPIAAYTLDEVNAKFTYLCATPKALRLGPFNILAVTIHMQPASLAKLPRRPVLVIFTPNASMLSDSGLRAVIAHELLHAAGVLDEDEVDRRVEEAARLRPELFGAGKEEYKAAERAVEGVEEVDAASLTEELTLGEVARLLSLSWTHLSECLEALSGEEQAGGESESGGVEGSVEQPVEESGGGQVEQESGGQVEKGESVPPPRPPMPVRARLWRLARMAVDSALRECGLRYFWQMRVNGMAPDMYEKYLRALERELAKLLTVAVNFKPERLPDGSYGSTEVYLAGERFGVWEPHLSHKVVGAFWNWVHRVYNLLWHAYDKGWVRREVL